MTNSSHIFRMFLDHVDELSTSNIHPKCVTVSGLCLNDRYDNILPKDTVGIQLHVDRGVFSSKNQSFQQYFIQDRASLKAYVS